MSLKLGIQKLDRSCRGSKRRWRKRLRNKLIRRGHYWKQYRSWA